MPPHVLRAFEELYEEYSERKKPNIILGNGFSIAALDQTFSYKTLRENLDVDELSIGEGIHGIFDHYQTSDFELVIRRLKESQFLANSYGVVGNGLEEDAEELKEQLVDAIADLHPKYPKERLENYQFSFAWNFISKFRHVFTLNYDLLLYWAIMKGARAEDRLDDGFRKRSGNLIWTGEHQERVFYLHGALHLYPFRTDDGVHTVQKVQMIEETSNILDEVSERLESDSFPLTVAEGTSETKRERIRESRYLSNCFENLISSTGAMFSYGASFANDTHVLEAIAHSDTTDMCVGLYRPDQRAMQTFKRTFSLVNHVRDENSRPDVNLHFFDSATVRVWR